MKQNPNGNSSASRKQKGSYQNNESSSHYQKSYGNYKPYIQHSRKESSKEKINHNHQIKGTQSIETTSQSPSNKTPAKSTAVVILEMAPMTSSVDSHLLKAMAIINGMSIPVIIDTGAAQSVIPTTLAERYKLTTHTSNITCNFGNNSKQHNVPITDPLEIVIFDTVVRLEFLVLPRNDILLGIDWLNMTEALVCSYNKSIIFKKRSISRTG